MNNFKILDKVWTTFFLILIRAELQSFQYIRTAGFDLMKCSYGERGSLTATCVNATANYFKNTPYRFDHLDETLRCLNCTLSTLETGSFDISGNQIRNLDLSNSLINTISQRAFVGLIFLERLILANNNIKSIYPGTFAGVKKIIYVDLENNTISTLSHRGFFELVSLEELNLRNNHIKNIEYTAFDGLVRLNILDLCNNELTDVKNIFNNLTALKLLDLSNNKISTLNGEDFNNLTSLLEIRFAHNYITAIPALEFFSMSNLKRLDLSFNRIDKIIAGSFRGLYLLQDLDLSYNNIGEVPQKTLQNLHNLQHLNISNNKLSIFRKGLYSGLPQLRVLNFSHNSIEDIEITGVFSLDSLDTLDFSYNNITDLDYVTLISVLPKISYLNLQDNFMPCDLDKEMENYFAEDNFKFILYRQESDGHECNDRAKTVTSKHNSRKNILDKESGAMSSSSANVWIFILISITLILVGILYYLQYRMYQEFKPYNTIKRSTSGVQLLSSDLEARDNEYLKE